MVTTAIAAWISVLGLAADLIGKVSDKISDMRDRHALKLPEDKRPAAADIIYKDGKMYRRRPTAVVVLAVLFLAASVSGCATKWTAADIKELLNALPQSCPPCEPCPSPTPTPPAPPAPPTPTPSSSFTVVPGKSMTRDLSVPCWVEFKMTGKLPSVEDGGPRDNCTIAWAYPIGGDWGGNRGAGSVGVRDYKLIAMNADGSLGGEKRFGVDYDPSKTYLVRLEVRRNGAFATVGDTKVDVSFSAAERYTVGIGWPPQQRPGPDGAVLSDIRWSE
jgi:hypothetical protein